MKATFLFLCILVFGAECFQHIILQDENPDHPRQCYNEWEKKYYKVGEEMKRKDTECVKRVCSGLVQDTKMEIRQSFCRPPFRECEGVKADLKKEYPDCCEWAISLRDLPNGSSEEKIRTSTKDVPTSTTTEDPPA